MDNKLKCYVVDKEYVSYLKKFDDKVENINYTERLKPYIWILITINEINYYVPISSVKEKHLYISFLSFELGLINDKIDKIKSNAVELYNEKINRPNSKISKRCCDFKLLEENAESIKTASKISFEKHLTYNF